jgi:hypothetical protein
MRRLLSHWLLVFLLAFAQEAAVVHLSQHAAERAGDRQTTSHTGDASCPKCAQFASFGSSPPAVVLVFKLALSQAERFEAVAYATRTRTVVAYQSRAPPILL